MNSEFLSFFWFISTQCNLSCGYCIARDYAGEIDIHHKADELEIADRLIEISKLVRRVKVDIGGIKEPLLIKNLDTIIRRLKSAPNIELSLTTNFSEINSIAGAIPFLDKILVSIHIKNRTTKETDHLIANINRYKKMTWIALTQVDYELEQKDLEEIARIEFETQIPVEFIMYQYSTTTANETSAEKIPVKKYNINPRGKLCSFGYLHFFILPDGTFMHDLFCRPKTRKRDNFLANLKNITPFLFPHDLKLCPYDYCSCNHNITFYEEYLNACTSLGHEKTNMFPNEYRSGYGILKSELQKLKYQLIYEKGFNRLKAQDNAKAGNRYETERQNAEQPDTLKNQQDEIARLRNTYSWRIGFRITETIKFLTGWLPDNRKLR